MTHNCENAGFTTAHTGSERQVLTHAKFITLNENILRRAHHSFCQVQGSLHLSFHSKKVKHRALFRDKEKFLDNVNKFKNSLNNMHVKLLEEKRELYPDILKRNSMDNSVKFQGTESVCSARLSHVSSKLVIVPNLHGMLSRGERQRPAPDTRDLQGTSGDGTENSPATME